MVKISTLSESDKDLTICQVELTSHNVNNIDLVELTIGPVELKLYISLVCRCYRPQGAWPPLLTDSTIYALRLYMEGWVVRARSHPHIYNTPFRFVKISDDKNSICRCCARKRTKGRACIGRHIL